MKKNDKNLQAYQNILFIMVIVSFQFKKMIRIWNKNQKFAY